MRNMRRSAVGLGLMVVLIGLFVVNQGTEVLTPLANVLGFTSHFRTETTLMAPTLLTVAPMNYTCIPAHLDGDVQVSGSFNIGGGREIDFYVMNQGNFSEWRAGRPSSVILAVLSTSLHNFTLTPRSGGRYYFVFDNEDSSRRAVVFSLSVINNVIVVNPVVGYLGHELLIGGILLFTWGLMSGRKKPARMEAPAAGWQCRFCGAENPLGQTFCESCGRSPR